MKSVFHVFKSVYLYLYYSQKDHRKIYFQDEIQFRATFISCGGRSSSQSKKAKKKKTIVTASHPETNNIGAEQKRYV